jgi:NADPH2:quinone reductase
MKNTRIVVTRCGGPEVMEVVEDECVPEPKDTEVRVRVMAAGVALPDVMARQGVHPETPRVPFTPGWDFVGIVDHLGSSVSDVSVGDTVAAMPIHGAYAAYTCVPHGILVPVPAGLDPAEAVCLILNYVTAYQMLHRAAKVQAGQRVLIHGASGGVGTALLQLGRLANLEMYGTCSPGAASTVSNMGATPIDYKSQDFISEIKNLTDDGADAVFDPIGGEHLWESRKVLRRGGKVVGYGNTKALRGKGFNPDHPGRRNRLHGIAGFAGYTLRSWFSPGRKRIVPYSIQTLMRIKPVWFREDLAALLDLLRQDKIKPIVADRLALSEARRAHELLEKGGVTGKLVLIPSA